MTQVPNDVENRPLERGRIKVMVGPVGLDYPRQAPETLAIPGIRTAVLPLNLPQRFACWLHWNQAASSCRTARISFEPTGRIDAVASVTNA